MGPGVGVALGKLMEEFCSDFRGNNRPLNRDPDSQAVDQQKCRSWDPTDNQENKSKEESKP